MDNHENAMTNQEIHIVYQEYNSIEELNPEDRELAAEAIKAMEGAYAPYSHFHVGAAVRMSNGQIVRGANQENALAGGVLGRLGSQPATPCGACRQVMAQYQAKSGKPMSVIMISAEKVWKFEKVDDILPLIFDSI